MSGWDLNNVYEPSVLSPGVMRLPRAPLHASSTKQDQEGGPPHSHVLVLFAYDIAKRRRRQTTVIRYIEAGAPDVSDATVTRASRPGSAEGLDLGIIVREKD